MKYIIGYVIGMIGFLFCFNIQFDEKKECRDFDGKEMCRTVFYGNWKETK